MSGDYETYFCGIIGGMDESNVEVDVTDCRYIEGSCARPSYVAEFCNKISMIQQSDLEGLRDEWKN